MCPQDKLLHFAVCILLMLLAGTVLSLPAAIIVTAAVGVGKEIYDAYYGTGWSNGDLVADAIGVITYILIRIV